MEHYEGDILKISAATVTAYVGRELHVSHETLTKLRFIESRCLPLVPILETIVDSSRTLKLQCAYNTGRGQLGAVDQSIREHSQLTMSIYEKEVAAYLGNAKYLLARVEKIAALLSDTLNLRHQATSDEQNGYMLQLTRSTVDDSTTIKVITVVTLVYLPFTFVATLLSMGVFGLDASNQLTVSPQLWIFFAISIPLTLVTMLWWVWKIGRREAHSTGEYDKGWSGNLEKSGSKWCVCLV